MKRVLLFVPGSLILILLLVTIPADASAGSVYDIPRLDEITIDGSGDDWKDRGFRVGVVTAPDGAVYPTHDFDVGFCLGWNADGLLALVDVADDIGAEHEDPNRMWSMDCVEFFLAEQVGSHQQYQLVVAPGADPAYGSMRTRLYDHRDERTNPESLIDPQAAAIVRDAGYTIEVLLPWQNLGIVPKPDLAFAFQLVANDCDGDDDGFRVGWYPRRGGPRASREMFTLRLSERPGEAELVKVRRVIDGDGYELSILAAAEIAGATVVVRTPEAVIARSELAPDDGRTSAVFVFDESPETGSWPAMEIEVAGKIVASYEELSYLGPIIERYIEAAGGREALEKASSRKYTGRLVHDLPWHDPPHEEVPFEGYTEPPDRWIVTFRPSEEPQSMGYDGENGWRHEEDGLIPDPRMARSRMAWCLNPKAPLLLDDYFTGISLNGKSSYGGRSYYIVEATDGIGRRRLLHFDAESGLLVKIGANWELLDYRDVGGVRVPSRIALSRKGGSSTYIFDEIEREAGIAGGTIAMPDPADVFPGVFIGIDDPKTLPMLKHLPHQHGGMNIPCTDGRFLYDIIVEKGYTRGLEIGTSNGYSTLWLALAFRENGGEVITIEYEPLRAQEAQRNFEKAGLGGVIDARIADGFEEIPKIEGEFDFVFIDAWKEDYFAFFELIKSRVRPGGVITAHNVISQARDMQDFLDAIGSDPALETAIHETSSSGISVSYVRK